MSASLSLSPSLSLSLSLFVGTPRMKNGHGPDSKRSECIHARNGGVRRPSQAGSAKSSPRPVSQPYGQPTKLSLLSLSPFLKDLEDEMAGKLAGPAAERGDGDKHACMRMAN